MTEKQEAYIESLLAKKEYYDENHYYVQAFKAGLRLNSKEVDELINYLLHC
ncbi:hypothetical protein [Listeria goaensis]|uniref:hypothetical protein n=1 Tax=Listeria goaensis TaxID=1649188 RepID=UPI0013C2E5E8|nr:hypothetical protein [Listeria goaensis]